MTIEIKNLNFNYGDLPVVRGLSLKIENGDHLGIIGPNGAGKTTVINLISGLIKPESGEIIIDDNPAGSYSRREMAKMIAVVPQRTEFAFSFSVLEIVLMGRYPYIKSFGLETETDLAKAKEAMVVTDTWNLRNRPIDAISGGERQRVLIARALAEEPEILLLDEPTTFLDIKHQIDIMNILKKLNLQKRLTVISAIHDINLAITYCNRIALLSNGRLESLGAPEEVITYVNLKKIFGAEVYVGVNEFNKKPYYIPMSGDEK